MIHLVDESPPWTARNDNAVLLISTKGTLKIFSHLPAPTLMTITISAKKKKRDLSMLSLPLQKN